MPDIGPYPSAREVAVTIIAAARLWREDPVLTAEGYGHMRGRHLALAALIAAFPDAPKRHLAMCCGFRQVNLADNAVYGIAPSRAKRKVWFRDSDVAIIKTALYAEIGRSIAPPPIPAERPTADSAPKSEPSAAAKAIAAYTRERFDRKTAPGPPSPQPGSTSVLVVTGQRKINHDERMEKIRRAEADAKASRALTLSSARGIGISYRADAPVHERNVDVVTAEFCGDPPPQRSALWARQNGETASPIQPEDPDDDL